MTFDPIAYLARRTLTGGQALRAAHRLGVTEGIRVFAHMNEYSGGSGIGNDGVWRSYTARGRKITLRIGDPNPESITVDARALIEWALRRLTGADHATLDQHTAEFGAAVRLRHDGDDGRLWFRNTYQPSTLTDAEREQIRESWRLQFAASRATRQLLDERFADHAPLRSGEQLDLFADIGGQP